MFRKKLYIDGNLLLTKYSLGNLGFSKDCIKLFKPVCSL